MGAPREIGFAGKRSGSRGYMKHCFSGFGPRGTGLWFLGRAGQSEAARSRPPTSHLSHFSSSGRSVAEGLVQNRGHRFGVRSVRRPRSAASARRGAARPGPAARLFVSLSAPRSSRRGPTAWFPGLAQAPGTGAAPVHTAGGDMSHTRPSLGFGQRASRPGPEGGPRADRSPEEGPGSAASRGGDFQLGLGRRAADIFRRQQTGADKSEKHTAAPNLRVKRARDRGCRWGCRARFHTRPSHGKNVRPDSSRCRRRAGAAGLRHV